MLQSDAQGTSRVDALANIHSLTVDIVYEIEKEIAMSDVVSVVFLLYDNCEEALSHLTMCQQLYKEIGENESKLLYNWARQVLAQPAWRYEFLEALTVCQLYSVIRNLGLQVPIVKRHFQSNTSQTMFLHPMKRLLYKLCEHLTTGDLQRLKNALKTYDIDTSEHDSCELVILELMARKFIIINSKEDDRNCNIEKLAKIIDIFPDLKNLAKELRDVQRMYNGDTGTPESHVDVKHVDEKVTAAAFGDLYHSMAQLNIEESDDEPTVKNIKSDTKKLGPEAYAIKNPKRVGVCYIINQEEFHPSKASIESNSSSLPVVLDKRLGSSKDKTDLEQTMNALNFEVICHRNIGHKQMIEGLQNLIEYRVHPDDSVFMLCILSHGVKGHVYAADSVLVAVQDIQNIMNNGFEKRKMLDIPKVLILQACQVNEEQSLLVADAPLNFHIRKSHFLIYWATAPELEAYRDEEKGSIFIQCLCHILKKKAKYEHLNDIFISVTDQVANVCTNYKKDQTPLFESTLRKKLFLQIPQ